MLPYFTIPSIHLFGSVSLQVYGVLLTLGIILGYRTIMRRAKSVGIPHGKMQAALIWAFVVGLVGAHLVEILFYQPELIEREGPLVFFKVLTGLSSVGAIFGGLLGFWIYYKRHQQPWTLPLSILLEGWVICWAFVRLGCALSHDHLGQKTSFVMGFSYPSGPRHNLGFYEFLVVILVLFPLTMIFRRWQARPGNYAGAIFMIYGLLRFGLDFLRASDLPGADPRYWGLTAVQYGMLVLTGAGLWMLLVRAAIVERLRARRLGPGRYPRAKAAITQPMNL
jgi:phosphatidylglycerol---prolipoprotein diacylglyceryl transferase